MQTMTDTTNPNDATPKQVAYLRRLCEERGLNLDDCPRPYATKRDASALIDHVLTLPVLRGEQAAPAPAAAPRAPRTVQVTEPGIYERDGEVYRVKRGRESGNLYASRMKVIGGLRATEAGTVVGIEFDYDAGAIFKLTDADRMTVARAKELCLQYNVCINCGAKLKDAASVELGIGPVCILKFVGGADALREARAAARAAKKAGGKVAPAPTEAERLEQLEAEGMSTSEAQAVYDAEQLRAAGRCRFCGKYGCPMPGECTDGEILTDYDAQAGRYAEVAR
jgi:hypothetical protein